MPAPIAKGIILSLSLIFAAGAAVYENPQVRQWVDENRRKVAIALHNLGDELAPASNRNQPEDVSRREDESEEAAERRRRARDEIMERGRIIEERKRTERRAQGRGSSFDDIVDKDGALRRDQYSQGVSSATQPRDQSDGLRHRGVETETESAAPPALEVDTSSAARDQDWSRSSTPNHAISPPVPPKPEAYQPQRALVTADEAASDASAPLIDLTPTTTESSTNHSYEGLDQSAQSPQRLGSESYMSVNEWAHNQSTQSFHSPSQSLSRSSTPTLENTSVVDSIEHASQAGTEDMDIMSDFGEGINTPSTWTEVGSQVSED